MSIRQLGVEFDKPCESLVGGKCSIYEDRPHVCRAFSCVWKSNIVDESLKPDRCGAVAKWGEDGRLVVLPIEKRMKDSTRKKWGRYSAKWKVKMQAVSR